MRTTCAILLTTLLALTACSTRKNTATTRLWHSFSARYNTYFNATQAYNESFQAQERGHKDDYTRTLPLFPVATEATRTIGSTGYETAITKAQKAIRLHSITAKPTLTARERQTPKGKQRLARQEYNPMLHHAWLLMGKAQFQRGEFIEAASTFAYITRHYAAEPRVAAQARIYLARCYTETGWYYDAENTLHQLRHDSLNTNLRRERDIAYAHLYLAQENYTQALPLLQSAATHSGSRLQRARTWYIIAQASRLTGDNTTAYKALRKVLRLSPPFELELSARILQTQVLATHGHQRTGMIKRLKRMARNPKYKDHLHKIYFALGNIHLTQGDTTEAIRAYEQGRQKSQTTSTEKGVLLLTLADLYWQQARFDLAQPLYSEAISMLSKENEGYHEATRRSQVLDKLVPHTTAIHLQDSLQELAAMSEEDRNAAIDRQIEAERHRQEEARRASRDSAAQALASEASPAGTTPPEPNAPQAAPTGTAEAGTFYFYNPQLVQQGKERFRQQWGARKNEDNWRRTNRTVLAEPNNPDEDDAQPTDSALQAQAGADSISQARADSLSQDENNPLKRAYYLKQIPFTPEAKAASDDIIMNALHQAGVIEKDDLGDLPLAERTLTRLVHQYPQYQHTHDAYYQLFLLYLRWGKPAMADRYRNLMAQHYPQSDTTRVITNPNFERNMRHGRHLEDSLYAATYNAFRLGDHTTVAQNTNISTQEFPDGINRPKFLLLSALTRLGKGHDADIAQELRELLKKYPESDVSHLAGMIVKGIESGRTVGSSGYDIGTLWSRRSAAANTDSTNAPQQFTAERATPFICLLAYPNDSIDNNQLLYTTARFNFTHFTSRTFDIESVRYPDITQFRIKGFTGYAEAHTYAQQFYAEPELAAIARKGRMVLISEQNIKLLGTTYSYDDYQQFYEENYAPMELPDSLPLDEPPMQYYEDELPPGRQPAAQPEHRDDPLLPADDDSSETYNIPLPTTEQQPQPEETTTPTQPEPQQPQEDEGETFPIPTTQPQQPTEETPTQPQQPQPQQPQPEENQEPEEDEDGEWYPI